MQSEQINELALALAKAQGAMQNPVKNKKVSVRTKTGGTYEFEYADLAAILDAVKKPLSDNLLGYVQLLGQTTNAEGATKYVLHTRLMHGSGQWIESITPLLVQEQGSQAFGSALTFMRRYALSAMLGIAADSDDDANTAEGNEAKVAEKNPKAIKSISLTHGGTTTQVSATLNDGTVIEPKVASTNTSTNNAAAGEPREVVLGDSPDWIWFGQTMIQLAGGPQWPDWDEANRTNFARMENEAPKVYARMSSAIKKAQKGVAP